MIRVDESCRSAPLFDGKVDIADFVLFLSYLSGSTLTLPAPLAVADINGDGSVTVADAIAFSRELFPTAAPAG